MKSRLTSVLFSPHSISNQEEQQEKLVETNNEEIENDEVWSQFKRKLRKETSDMFVLLLKMNIKVPIRFISRSSSKLDSKKKRKTTVLSE